MDELHKFIYRLRPDKSFKTSAEQLAKIRALLEKGQDPNEPIY